MNPSSHPSIVREIAQQGLTVPEIRDRFSLGRQPARLLHAAAQGYRLSHEPEDPLDILVVGDQHITPGAPTEHFDWLANLVRDRKPAVLVNVGDVIDNVSFSSHAGEAEKSRYNYIEELEAGLDAWDVVMDACIEVGTRTVLTEGNHDDVRLGRFLKKAPWLKGAIAELGPMMSHAGWEVVPFQVPFECAGIRFAHYFVSGVMGKSIGGVNPARAMAMKLMDSALAGHSHEYAVRTINTAFGRQILAGPVGCFIHPDSDVSDWAGPQAVNHYDRGVVYLHGAAGGTADVEWVSFERLKRLYAR